MTIKIWKKKINLIRVKISKTEFKFNMKNIKLLRQGSRSISDVIIKCEFMVILASNFYLFLF